MSIPNQKFTIRDPGLGLIALSGTAALFVGTAQKGAIGEVIAFNAPQDVVDTYGEGELSEDLCHALVFGGGPQYGCRVTGSVAGTNTDVTADPIDDATGTITVAGAPLQRLQVVITIAKTGTLGTAEFTYSLDNGRTVSEQLVIPAGGTFALPNTGLTLTFVPGDGPSFFEAGDAHTFNSTAPHYSATEVAAAFTALNTYFSITPEFVLDFIVLSGRNATGSGAATIFGALSTQLASMFQMGTYLPAIMDGGSTDTIANVKTAFAALTDRSICVCYGTETVTSAKPFAGYSELEGTLVRSTAARACRELPSTDLARVASGPLDDVSSISHDEFVDPELDDAKITTTRTWRLSQGYFLTNARLKSPSGSDYLYWQHIRLMYIACRVADRTQQLFMSGGFIANADGSLVETEAIRLESAVQEALKVALIDPQNAEGRPGHVSAFKYSVDRKWDVLQTQIIKSYVAIRPLAYAKELDTELGYTADLDAAA